MKCRVLWIWLVIGTAWIILAACAAVYGGGFLDTSGWRIGIGGGRSRSSECLPGQCPAPISSRASRPAPPRAARPQPRAQARTPCPAIVQIHSKRGDSTKKGTGSVVAWREGRALILTCAHILRAGWDPSVVWPDGRSLPARFVCADAYHDCALLEVQTPSCRCIRLAAAPPTSGQVSWEGYGEGGYRGSNGRVIGIDGDFLVIQGETRNGDSGSPIWGLDGGLVAILNDASQLNLPGEPWKVSGPHIGWIRGLIGQLIWRDGYWKPSPQIIPGAPPEDVLVPVPDPWPPQIIAGPPIFIPVPDQEAGPCTGLAEIQAELAKLRQAIAELALKPGIPGPPGPTGAPGLTPVIKPWYLRTVDARTGKETITEINPLDTVTLKLYTYPKPKPK